MALTLSIITFLLLSHVFADTLNFDIHVLEKQARYSQKIQTDLSTDHVYYATPAHNDVFESHRMQDFTRGLQVTCLPALKECHLAKIDKINYPNAGNLTEAIVHMWNKGVNSIVDETADVISHKLILTGTEIVNTAFLSQSMRDLIATFGFPLYMTKPIPKDAVIQRFPEKEMHTIKSRTLSASITQFKCGGNPPETKYGYTEGTHCDHLYLCRNTPTPTVNGITCNNNHITTSLFYKCLCCHGYFTLHDLKHCQCFRFDA